MLCVKFFELLHLNIDKMLNIKSLLKVNVINSIVIFHIEHIRHPFSMFTIKSCSELYGLLFRWETV